MVTAQGKSCMAWSVSSYIFNQDKCTVEQVFLCVVLQCMARSFN